MATPSTPDPIADLVARTLDKGRAGFDQAKASHQAAAEEAGAVIIREGLILAFNRTNQPLPQNQALLAALGAATANATATATADANATADATANVPAGTTQTTVTTTTPTTRSTKKSPIFALVAGALAFILAFIAVGLIAKHGFGDGNWANDGGFKFLCALIAAGAIGFYVWGKTEETERSDAHVVPPQQVVTTTTAPAQP